MPYPEGTEPDRPPKLHAKLDDEDSLSTCTDDDSTVVMTIKKHLRNIMRKTSDQQELYKEHNHF